MSQPLSNYIFLSYSRKDLEIVHRIVDFLRSQGIRVWLDNERLIPGTPIWEEEIEKAIFDATAVVVILSPDAKGSEWVRREITLTEQYKKRIFPVLVRGDENSSISLRLITRQFVDLRHNEDVGLNSLSAALRFYLEEIGAQERQAVEERPPGSDTATGQVPLQKVTQKAHQRPQQTARGKSEMPGPNLGRSTGQKVEVTPKTKVAATTSSLFTIATVVLVLALFGFAAIRWLPSLLAGGASPTMTSSPTNPPPVNHTPTTPGVSVKTVDFVGGSRVLR